MEKGALQCNAKQKLFSSFHCISSYIAAYKNRPPFGRHVKCQGPTFCRYIPTRPAAVNSAAKTFSKWHRHQNGGMEGEQVDNKTHLKKKGYGIVTLALQAPPGKHKATVLKGSSSGRSLSGMEMSSVTGRTHLRVINDFIKCTSRPILR